MPLLWATWSSNFRPSKYLQMFTGDPLQGPTAACVFDGRPYPPTRRRHDENLASLASRPRCNSSDPAVLTPAPVLPATTAPEGER